MILGTTRTLPHSLGSFFRSQKRSPQVSRNGRLTRMIEEKQTVFSSSYNIKGWIPAQRYLQIYHKKGQKPRSGVNRRHERPSKGSGTQ